ncbi:MAG: PP2C family protein-serine/threonine phosphatase [Bryobacterales bacterium]|nr:PP2C family protein-serine/threonine phosphatase [Bryobacterales bacterium]
MVPKYTLDKLQLEDLLESVEVLNATLSLPDILQHLLRISQARALATRGVAAVRNASGNLEAVVTHGVRGIEAGAVVSEDALREKGLEAILPIGTGVAPTGLIALGGVAAKDFEMSELPGLRILLGFGATAIANATAHDEAKRLNERMNQRLQELRALLDFGRGLTSTLDAEEVVQMLALTFAGRWAISRYAVHAWRDGQDHVFRARGFTFAQAEALAGHHQNLNEAVILGAGEELEWLRELGVPPGSMLIPLRSSEQMIGLILCGTRLNKRPYKQEDLEFGLTMASRAAGSLENAWFLKEALVAREIERELQLAANIQQDLFPKRIPVAEGWEVAARNRQARQVGGDYFDGMRLMRDDSRRILYLVADVAGKGIGSALLMSNIQATLRALLDHEPTLQAVAREANQLLFANTPSNRYATAFLLLLDPETGFADFVNCAHNNPLLLRANGEVELLDGPGLALGLMAFETQEQAMVEIRPGDILAIYTDGVSEALNLEDEEFGIERLGDVMKRLRSEDAETIVEGIFQAIEYHVGDAPQHDDITLMVLRRKA